MSPLVTPSLNSRQQVLYAILIVLLLHLLFISFLFLKTMFLPSSSANLPLSETQKIQQQFLEFTLKEYPVFIADDDVIELIKKKIEHKAAPTIAQETKEKSHKEALDAPQTIGFSVEFRKTYIGQVIAQLSANKYYPESERRREREGRVLVAFTIYPDGSVANIHIKDESLYTLLNQAAIDTVKKSAPFPPFESKKNQLDMQVVIDYRLDE
ncbi:MAG: energy transducer TonB [Spirochaetia bacterium]